MRVCILGNGISSLTIAKALVNQKIYVDLLLTNKIDKPDKSRTIGISKSNADFFNDNIINIKKIIWKLNKIEIFTENLEKEKILCFENHKNELFSIVKNFQLFDILQKSLLRNKYFKKINIKKNINFQEKYNLVINTDSQNYITKKYFNNRVIKKYNSFAYTTIIKHSKIKNNTATQIFTKWGPIAFLPVSDYETSLVCSLHNFENSKTDNILGFINKYNFKYKINKINKIKSFELKSLNLRSYYYNNILAFGDLLHRVHPLAGQGFNMTIRDIKLLLEIIKKRVNLGLPLDSSVNFEFEKKIKHRNFIFSNGIDFIHEFFNLERKFNNTILSKSVKVFGKNNSINKVFTKLADRGFII